MITRSQRVGLSAGPITGSATKQSRLSPRQQSGLRRGACHRAIGGAAGSQRLRSSRMLSERLAKRNITLLLLAPVTAPRDRAVDHQIMAVDETRLIACQENRGVRDVIGQA